MATQINRGTDPILPIELGPEQHSYLVLSCVVGFPALLWLIATATGMKMPVQFFGIFVVCVVGVVFMIFYLKNMTIRLDESGISQGFPIFRRFIAYEKISGVHREARSFRGASTTVLVVSDRDGAKRIVVPLRSFDQTKLTQTMALVASKAPQAHIEDALYIQFRPW